MNDAGSPAAELPLLFAAGSQFYPRTKEQSAAAAFPLEGRRCFSGQAHLLGSQLYLKMFQILATFLDSEAVRIVFKSLFDTTLCNFTIPDFSQMVLGKRRKKSKNSSQETFTEAFRITYQSKSFSQQYYPHTPYFRVVVFFLWLLVFFLVIGRTVNLWHFLRSSFSFLPEFFYAYLEIVSPSPQCPFQVPSLQWSILPS